jgi:seryl-tRNA synthetase
MGKTPEENLNVFEEPVLHEGAQPHWELVKNMISLILN